MYIRVFWEIFTHKSWPIFYKDVVLEYYCILGSPIRKKIEGWSIMKKGIYRVCICWEPFYICGTAVMSKFTNTCCIKLELFATSDFGNFLAYHK